MPAFSGLTVSLTARNATATDTTPRSADEAAALLLDEGKHVHLVADGQATCLIDTCPPVIGEAVKPSTP